MLRVVVLYNAPVLPGGHPDADSEADVVGVAGAVVEGLKRRGMEAWSLGAAPPIVDMIDHLMGDAPDVVFNLIEGFGGASGGEAHITGLLELLRLPYTGCPPEAQALCHAKGRTKALLIGSGLPTAPFALIGPDDPIPSWGSPGPIMVKPDGEDASLGIDQESVTTNPSELPRRVARLRASHGGRVLLESYLPGREFNVGVIGLPRPEPLPIAEVVFKPLPGSFPILSYAAKWAVGSAEDLASPIRCPAEVEPALADRLGPLACAAFRATGCRDYARVDIRLDARGEPMILEVNPNPDIGPEAGWARALRASGRDYDETLAALARQAFHRDRRRVGGGTV